MAVVGFPKRDLIDEMTGPSSKGSAVIIDGRLVPNVLMFDRDDQIEFVLDNRLSFTFPRGIAWLAASFAFSSMAVAAGFASPGGPHFTQQPFAREVRMIDGLDEAPNP